MTRLQSELGETKTALDSVQAELDAKKAAEAELEAAKQALEDQLKNAQDNVATASTGVSDNTELLETIKGEVRNRKICVRLLG